MNLPNQLTVSRLALTLALLVALFTDFPFAETLALVLFIVASVTDYYDGKIARARNITTNFGILMDPLADKILVCSVFIAFVGRGLMPAWMAVVIVSRELVITGLRLLAASQQVVLAAERHGKHKTASQITAIIAVLTLVSYPDWGGWARLIFDPWVPYFAHWATWVAVLLTITSGATYLWRNRPIFLNDL